MKTHKGSFIVTKEMVTNGRFNQKLPDKIIGGNFTCSYLGLTTLEGCPKEVTHDFICSHNKLITLKHSPIFVGNNFHCSHNSLTTLEGCSDKVSGSFFCAYNMLTNLDHLPNKIRGFNCSNNQLTSLINSEGQSLKSWFKGIFDCSNNQLTSLKGGPRRISKDFNCSKNLLTSLEYGPSIISKWFSYDGNAEDLRVEAGFLISKKYINREKYWQDLFKYMQYEELNLDRVKGWPDKFIKSLNDQHQNLFSSYKSINKYSL